MKQRRSGEETNKQTNKQKNQEFGQIWIKFQNEALCLTQEIGIIDDKPTLCEIRLRIQEMWSQRLKMSTKGRNRKHIVIIP